MPIYEYKCNQCGDESEILHKSSNITSVECPGCGSEDMEKLISAPGAVMTKGATAAQPMPACPNREACGSRACPGALN